MDVSSAVERSDGEPFRVRPGEYVVLPGDEEWWERTRTIHEARLRSAVEHVGGAIAVLRSAALVHGAQLKHLPDQAHVWSPWHRRGVPADHGRLWEIPRPERSIRLGRRPVVNHHMDVDQDDVCIIDGIAVVGVRQAILQCARFLPPDEAFVAVESLLAIAVGRDSTWREHRKEIEEAADRLRRELLADLATMPGRRGVRQAREVLTVASPFSESVYESEFRRIALAAGYPDLEPQMQVRTHDGTKWADVGHRRARVCFEISGDVKYEGDQGPSYRIGQLQRDSAIEDAGYRVVNLSSHDVQLPEVVLAQLDRYVSETRERRGVRALWTTWERHRFA